jgi:type IX secretion system PorP/SprF family membrane protein
MKRLLRLIVIIAACVAETAQAQRDAQFSQHFFGMNYYNPATVGKSGSLDLTALYRLQWLGWDNAPKTMFASAGMPFNFLKKEHGVGFVYVKDTESSLYATTTMALQYAFLMKLGKGTLRIGIQPGLVTMTAGGGEVILPVDSAGNAGASDPAIPTGKIESKSFDANIGIYYATPVWFAGIAVTHVLEPKFEDENLNTFINRGYNFTAGYNIQTNNPLLVLQPSVFAKTDLVTYQAEVTARAVYAGKYSAGLAWRKDDAIILLLGATLGKIEGGYAYDFPISAVRRGTTGSHELFVKYRMQLTKPKTGKSKHKSVRLL